jgi:CRISPR-associated protein Csh2
MEKRSFIVLYDTKWNTPNGNPFTGEQRYDNANEKLMVSSERIKRFIRDFLITISDILIFYKYDSIEAKKVINQAISGSSFRFREELVKRGYISSVDSFTSKDIKKININEFMKEFLDIRLFGGIVTEKDNSFSFEGAVQFKNLSYSLNKIKPEVFQNTTIFPSKIKNEQGSIGTTTIIPYSIIAIEGWLNEQTAEINKLTEFDIDMMLSALWLGIRDKNTKSKSGQTPLLSLEIVYQEKDYKFNPDIKVYKPIQNPLSLISIKTDIEETDIRCREDYSLQLESLISECAKDNVKVVNFYTEDDVLKKQLESCSKFKFKELY